MNKTHWSDGLLLWVCESPSSYRAVLDGGIMAIIHQSYDGAFHLFCALGVEGRYSNLGRAMSALQEALDKQRGVQS